MYCIFFINIHWKCMQDRNCGHYIFINDFAVKKYACLLPIVLIILMRAFFICILSRQIFFYVMERFLRKINLNLWFNHILMCNKIKSCYIFMLNLETDGAWKFLNQMEIPLPSNQSGLQFLFFCKEAQNSEWLECSFNKITFLKKKNMSSCKKNE